jgi:transcription elongation factor Elf1
LAEGEIQVSATTITADCGQCGRPMTVTIPAGIDGVDMQRLFRMCLCDECARRREALTTNPDPDEPERLRPTREPELQSWADRSQPKED